MGTFGPKHQNCQLKLKFGTQTNSNVQKVMLIFVFCFKQETLFLGKFGPKIKFENQTNSNMQKSMAVFILSVLDHKYSFWINCFQKYFDKKKDKNLIKKKKKIQNCHFKLKFGTQTNWNMQISMVTFISCVFE